MSHTELLTMWHGESEANVWFFAELDSIEKSRVDAFESSCYHFVNEINSMGGYMNEDIILLIGAIAAISSSHKYMSIYVILIALPGHKLVEARSTQLQCAESEYACKTKCIELRRRWNGVEDCEDGEDEILMMSAEPPKTWLEYLGGMVGFWLIGFLSISGMHITIRLIWYNGGGQIVHRMVQWRRVWVILGVINSQTDTELAEVQSQS